MFRDPYSERQGLQRFFLDNFVLISLALILAGMAGYGLALFFRAPGLNRAAPPAGMGSQAAVGEESQGQKGNPGQGAQLERDEAEGDWRLTLVNAENPMPEGREIVLASLRSGQQVDERILGPLNQMLAAAANRGLSVVVASAYRTVDRQRELYDEKVRQLVAQGFSREQAEGAAVMEVAYPGNSEHHLGLAVDLVSSRYQLMNESQSDTEENKWLRENCHEYGFVLRYPPYKTLVTGVVYEPWHFRYVGIEAAKAMTERNLALEEYLEAM